MPIVKIIVPKEYAFESIGFNAIKSRPMHTTINANSKSFIR